MSRTLREKRPYTLWRKQRGEWTLVATFADQGNAIDRCRRLIEMREDAIVTKEQVWWPLPGVEVSS
jgi:hypothetical protein